mmetsp:Transcript_68593/g.139575  ORF Transcript_68593/g.139575 Transcript_68593/m.139575 type:complete len:527 (+) Transcript_68593:158-1738(+)
MAAALRDNDDARNPGEEETHPVMGHVTLQSWQSNPLHQKLKALAGVMGNVLEWYDFAVFGFFSDVIGKVFFPKDQSEDLSVMESFAVFGGAFLMRPIGGLVIGYIGDTSGRKKALEISLFLMALATTLMGCLPTYEQIGNPAILLLLIVRMLQGLSVGGQLISSLVFTLEGRSSNRWGLYGSFVMAAANIGTFLGGVVSYGLRYYLTEEQLLRWGWRIPFLSGIMISFCGIYLKYFCTEDDSLPGHDGPMSNCHSKSPETITSDVDNEIDDVVIVDREEEMNTSNLQQSTMLDTSLQVGRPINPLRIAFSLENRRSLLASAMVPIVWSGGFYLSFVWMAIFMKDLIDPPVPSAFLINSCSILMLCILFPLAGSLSDIFGRRQVMTVGGIIFGSLGPILLLIIGKMGADHVWVAFCSQMGLGVSLSLWGAPMCAWLVEEFEPEARLTSVSIGYNLAQALAGGMSPFVATLLIDEFGTGAPGILLSTLATVSLIGLWGISPKHKYNRQSQEDDSNDIDEVDLELTEIT